MHRLAKLYVQIPSVRPGSPGAYGLAVAIVAGATVLRMAIEPFVAGIQYITFFPAVIATTLISGVRAGFLAMVLSALAAWLFVLPPIGKIEVAAWDQIVTVGFFLTVSSADVLLIGALRYAIAQYQELSRTLEKRVEERTEELIKTQQALAQAQKAEAIGQLTGGLAHDFNNLLAVIIGSLDLLRRRLPDSERELHQYVDHAAEGAQRGAQLTQSLLAFARRQPLQPRPVDVNRLVRGLCDLLGRTLGEKIRLECVTAGGLWATSIDANQLENAIINLAANARDAMPGGGALTIETGNAHLDEDYARHHEDVAAGQYVMVAVTDSGIGMSPETLARALDPFFTTKPAEQGTGLGLSQVFGFAKQSGGHLSIYSEEGRGTTVRLYLPRYYGAPAEQGRSVKAPCEEGPEKATSGETILLVEDEERVRRTSAAQLRELGYRVVEAASAAEALALLENHPEIVLLFTDVVMPDMDGRSLANAARELRPDLKVLFTTGYTRNAIVHDSILDPDVFLIVKPFTASQLGRKVRSVIESGRGDQ